MKKILSFLLLFVFAFALVGCGETPDNPDDKPDVPTLEKYTVKLYVDDVLYKTLKVEENKKIGATTVANPTKDGFEFVCWTDKDGNLVDLDVYIVKANLNLYASFKKIEFDDVLEVEGVKEEGVDYYLVVGWWETTAVDDAGNPKVTSSLTPDTVRVFYTNLILYLKAYGATDEQIKLVQFRNYSTEKVAEMGTLVNSDGDVDILIGVGNNINTTAGVSLFEGNDGKTTALMGSQSLSRYVALPLLDDMSKAAISVFDWIKTEVGQKAFTTQLVESEIVVVPDRIDSVNLTVTVHGLDASKDVVTVLTSTTDLIDVPEITIPENKKFIGYATSSDSKVAEIACEIGEKITYKDIETLLGDSTTLELFPILIDEVVIETEFDVEGVKEEGVDYYFVVGWWESVGKVTSSLTPDTVKIFYANLILYLKAAGATDEQISKIQFRNYSTEKVLEMGEKVNADGDVDLMIGVGGNINTTAGVPLFDGEYGKITAIMGTENKQRTIAIPLHDEMNKLAISVFDWLKTEVGQTAFITKLTESDIVLAPERPETLSITITVHGLESSNDKVTVLTSTNDLIEVPTITVPENYKFVGYATSSDAKEANVVKELDVKLTYSDIEALLGDNNTLELFPVFEKEETQEELVLDVEGVKEEGVDYYLVVGWWETTTEGKVTSSLTPETVKIFYANLILYLKAAGATDEQIKKVQFRNYSTEKVGPMGELINNDGDVDLLIGVGNNINTTAGVSLFEDNDGKIAAPMGTQSISRYVALPLHEQMNKLAISVFDWIKTEVGQTAFTNVLSASDIVVVPERTA